MRKDKQVHNLYVLSIWQKPRNDVYVDIVFQIAMPLSEFSLLIHMDFKQNEVLFTILYCFTCTILMYAWTSGMLYHYATQKTPVTFCSF